MKAPTLTKEQQCFASGFSRIAGLDEAGRGAWAGPLVAAALVLEMKNLRTAQRLRAIVRDSKVLNASQRERAYAQLTASFPWGIGVVESDEVDALGVTAANQQAFHRACHTLSVAADFLLVDGRGFTFTMPHRHIIDGDATVFSIAAASIVAKVVRDRLMLALDARFPRYGFCRHKGYGTPEHQQMLVRFGSCPIHRKTYRPVLRVGGKGTGHDRGSQERKELIH